MKILSTMSLAMLLSSFTAYAASTGTLVVSGSVPAISNITVNPSGTNNTTLDILNGESGKLVATVHEQCNNLAGYKINAKSTNGSELRNTADATKKTTYTVSYDGATAVTLTTSYQQVKNVSSLSGMTNTTVNVNLNVNAYATAPAGTYNDTITFQIVAN